MSVNILITFLTKDLVNSKVIDPEIKKNHIKINNLVNYPLGIYSLT